MTDDDRYHCRNCGAALPEMLVDGPVAGDGTDTPAVELCGSCEADAIVTDDPTCPVCEHTITEYDTRQSIDGLCPHCGTKVRHRIERERPAGEQTTLRTDGGQRSFQRAVETLQLVAAESIDSDDQCESTHGVGVRSSDERTHCSGEVAYELTLRNTFGDEFEMRACPACKSWWDDRRVDNNSGEEVASDV